MTQSVCMGVGDLVWHYTVGEHFEKILCDKYIRPTRGKILGREHGVVWFSANQEMENTVRKGAVINATTGEFVTVCEREELASFFDGLYRIGVNRELLKPWIRLQKLAHYSVEHIEELETRARSWGANPFDWWGRLLQVPVGQWKAVHKFDVDSKVWVDASNEFVASKENLSDVPKLMTP